MKKTVKKQRFLLAKASRLPFQLARAITQLPQKEAPKKTTSSWDRSDPELSREPFIRAVLV